MLAFCPDTHIRQDDDVTDREPRRTDFRAIEKSRDR